MYLKGELVWAKVSGFPWWPGVIKSIHLKRKRVSVNHKMIIKYEDEPRAFIKFVGDHTHIVAPLSEIHKFCNKFHEFSQLKNKGVQKAIELAKRLLAQSKVRVPATILYDFLGKKRLKTITQSKDQKESKKQVLYSKNKKWKAIENHIKNKKKITHKSIKEDEANNNSKANNKDDGENEAEDNSRIEHESRSNDDDDDISNQYNSPTRKVNGVKSNRKNAKVINDDDDDDDDDSDSDSEYASSIESEKNDSSLDQNCDDLKEIIDHLFKIKIEKRTKESYKYIIEALEDILSIMSSNNSNNTYIVCICFI